MVISLKLKNTTNLSKQDVKNVTAMIGLMTRMKIHMKKCIFTLVNVVEDSSF